MNPSCLPWLALLDSPGTPVALDLVQAGWTLLFLAGVITPIVLVHLHVGTLQERAKRRFRRMREERERRVMSAHFPESPKP